MIPNHKSETSKKNDQLHVGASSRTHAAASAYACGGASQISFSIVLSTPVPRLNPPLARDFSFPAVHSLTTASTKRKHCRSDQRHNQKRNGSSCQCEYPLKGREVNNGILVVVNSKFNDNSDTLSGDRGTENLKMVDCV